MLTGSNPNIEDVEERITEPFDPEQIRIRTVPFLVQQLVSRIDHNDIELQPDFQRLQGIWSIRNRSRLVESLVLKIPLPVFYVYADANEHWSVVDGVQRMSTIYDFVKDKLELRGLEYMLSLNGKKHHVDLPYRFQRRISETQIVVNVIEHGTPRQVMENVFRRINTGGVPLNAQEIRHAVYPGPVRKFLKDLSTRDEFKKATDYSVRERRMRDRECVLRFLAFRITPPSKYPSRSLNEFLGHTMETINAMDDAQRAELAFDFSKAMEAAFDIFGSEAFRKPPDSQGRRNSVSLALLETWGLNLSKCTPEQIRTLVDKKDEVSTWLELKISEDTDFERSISYSTADRRLVLKRFDTIGWIIREVLQC